MILVLQIAAGVALGILLTLALLGVVVMVSEAFYLDEHGERRNDRP